MEIPSPPGSFFLAGLGTYRWLGRLGDIGDRPRASLSSWAGSVLLAGWSLMDYLSYFGLGARFSSFSVDLAFSCTYRAYGGPFGFYFNLRTSVPSGLMGVQLGVVSL